MQAGEDKKTRRRTLGKSGEVIYFQVYLDGLRPVQARHILNGSQCALHIVLMLVILIAQNPDALLVLHVFWARGGERLVSVACDKRRLMRGCSGKAGS